MSTIIDSIEQRQLRPDLPRFKAGDTLRVHFQVIEGTRRRIQVFEGIVIKRQGSGMRETFTVRKQSFGVGVERTFPLHSPKIEKIEVAAIGDVNRAKLYYLRGKVGKKARVRELRQAPGAKAQAAQAQAQADAAAPAAVESEAPVRRRDRRARRDRSRLARRRESAHLRDEVGTKRAEAGAKLASWRVAAGRGSSRSTGSSVRASSRAPTRRGAAPWQGRSSWPASCSTTTASATIACVRLRC